MGSRARVCVQGLGFGRLLPLPRDLSLGFLSLGSLEHSLKCRLFRRRKHEIPRAGKEVRSV